jgi:hypothetical protein
MSVMHDSDAVDPEDRHRACWYGRRTSQLPDVPTVQTIEDGQLLFCAHPMMFPVVGHDFDIRNCIGCDAHRPGRTQRP